MFRKYNTVEEIGVPRVVFTKDGMDLCCVECEKPKRWWKKWVAVTFETRDYTAYEYYHLKCLLRSLKDYKEEKLIMPGFTDNENVVFLIGFIMVMTWITCYGILGG